MKIAFLILAHYQPAMLARLIGRLHSDSSYFFIHLDAKSDGVPFKKLTDSYSNVIYVADRDRHDVLWGGFDSDPGRGSSGGWFSRRNIG